MNMFKKSAIGVAIAATITVAFTTPVQAADMAYWDFYKWHTGSSFPESFESNSWTSSSTANEVRIKGYQDSTVSTQPADIEYAVCEKTMFGCSSNWVPKRIRGNFTQGGTWYDHTFVGVPNGRKIAVRLKVYNGYPATGAGNAYQS